VFILQFHGYVGEERSYSYSIYCCVYHIKIMEQNRLVWYKRCWSKEQIEIFDSFYIFL